MGSNKPAPPSGVRNASTIIAEEFIVSGSPDEVVVELEELDPAAKTRRADAKGAGQPPGSICLVEDANAQGGRGTFTEQVESPAVQALRECLAILDRDRHAAEARWARCPEIIQRYLACGSKAA